MFDSGVRTGSDVTKALAWVRRQLASAALTLMGTRWEESEGIVHMLRSLLAEADLLMAVDGYPKLADLRPEALPRV